MITVNELRIGNLGYCLECDGETKHIGTCDEIKKNGRAYANNWQITEPIPIKEWFVRLKLSEDKSTIGINGKYGLCFQRDGNELYLIVSDDEWQEDKGIIVHVKYVHQYQNLFFDLTGEELTIKE